MVSTQAKEWLKKHPKKLFLIDGLGAMLSAFLLAMVLAPMEQLVGIPRTTLDRLALVPCLFVLYDLYCYYFTTNKPGAYLKGIAAFNTAYCCLSLILVINHFRLVTFFGWSYLLLEIAVIMMLASVEWKLGAAMNKKIEM
jgi:hypothetical protein